MEDDHLMRMLELTGETFSSSMLERSERHDEFFDKNGRKMVFMLQSFVLNNCHLPGKDARNPEQMPLEDPSGDRRR